MMDTPGAFEKVATESFYYITPPEKDWPEAQVEEWLAVFNYDELDDVSPFTRLARPLFALAAFQEQPKPGDQGV